MLVGEQRGYHGDSHPGRPWQLKTPRQPGQQRDHYDVHGAGNGKRPGDAETFWHGKKSRRLVVLDVLAGVEHVEAADPERYSRAENQHARIERASDGNPR